MSTFEAAISGGLSVVHSAAVAGLCRSGAYRLARALGLTRCRTTDGETRRRVLEAIAAGGGSLRAIADACGVSKATVIRIRDRAAQLGARRQFRATRSAYICPGCGLKIRVTPCVACAATGATCLHGE